MMSNRFAKLPLLALLSVMLLATAAYWPGLRGGFLFDDFANLPALGATGPVNDWPTFWRYITSGVADPTGRPLTLLTFLLDANDWPAAPYSFKLTNLTLHLFNGALLYALLTKLGQTLSVELYRCQIAAAFGTSLWLLHPLLVSTTLYVVQREAMLPATCVLSGLLFWLHGRERLSVGKRISGLVWSVIGLGGFTLLGLMAKANGALLPFYAFLIEVIVLAPRHPFLCPRGELIYRITLIVFVVIPTLTICTYLIWVGAHGIYVGGNAGIRPWSYAQRLLTEPRVLMDYLRLLWLPRPFSSGLFNDQYIVSSTLWNPATTLAAIVAVLALIGGAWRVRRRYPALALSILFYFAAQLLESTSLPLELYFEHRNYVPALLMFWPLGLWLAHFSSIPTLKRMLLVILPIGFALLTHARAEVWGDVRTQGLLWAQLNPDSARAQANAAQIEMQMGQPEAAIHRLEKILATEPDQVQIAFNLIAARCLTGGISQDDINAARRAMRGSPNTGPLFVHWFDRTLPVAVAGDCRGLTPEVLIEFLDTGLTNPKLSAAGPQQDLTYLRGRIALTQHRPDAALAEFTRALDLQVRPDMALEAAATLGAAGYPRHGLRLLNHYKEVRAKAAAPALGMPTLHEKVLAHQNYWANELWRLEKQLNLDAKEDEQSHTSQPHMRMRA